MSIYKARWKNALKWAAKVNRLLKKGFIVFDKDGNRCNELFSLKDKQIVQVSGSPGHTFSWMWFENNLNYDHGLYTPIKEYNKRFEGMTAVHPKDIIKV